MVINSRCFVNSILFIALLSLFLSLKFFVYAILIMCLLLINTSQITSFLKNIIPFLLVISLLVLFSFLKTSLGNQLPYPIYEARDIFISVFIMVTLCSLKGVVVNKTQVIKYLTVLSCLVALAKFIILIYCIKNGINPSYIVHQISDATGWQLMTYDIDDSLISRIQFPVDLVGCFLIYFQTKIAIESKSKKNTIILGLLFFSSLITMSRAFWFISVVLFALAFFVSENKKSKRKYIFFILFSSVAIYGVMYESINSIIASRLDSSLNSSSDYTRQLQNDSLEKSFYESPLLGHGIGYFIPTFIRGEGDNKYAYESQLLSMLMKLGIIGFCALLSSIFYVVFSSSDQRVSGGRNSKVFLLKFVFVSLWLFSGAVNPLLFSVPGGMVLYLAASVE